MSFTLPPVVMLAERLLVDIEQSVRRFARFHKYTFGSDLRTSAMEVATLAHRAWREPARRRKWLDRLVHAVDDLKLRLQQLFHARYPWLAPLTNTPRRFDYRLEGRRLTLRTRSC